MSLTLKDECARCGEPYAKWSTDTLCMFCVGEIRHKAVTVLTEVQGDSDRDKLTRGNAIEALHILGHSQEEVVHARARAFDGHSVEQIVSGLCGDERVGVAA
jgi:hypothetical protein